MDSLVVAGTPRTAAGQTAARGGASIGRLTAMELRKLVRRPMTWAIFGLPAALGAVMFPMAYLVARAQGTVAALGPRLFPPGYISSSFDVLIMLGTICVAVLAAGVIGSEYGWGTIRVLIGTGAPRSRLLGSKLIALSLAVAAWIVTSFAVISLSSILVTAVSGHAVSLGQVDATWLGQLGLMFGRTWLVLEAWMTMAVAASVVGRSLAAGIAVPIVWEVIEAILSRLAPFAGSLGTHVSDLLIQVNSLTFQAHNVFGTPPTQPGAVSQAHAVLVFAGYIVVLISVAAVVFIRRDYSTGA